jgi:endonuclease-3
MTPELSNKIIRALREYYGPISTALHHRNLYQLSVAVILSAQTTDRQVNQVTPRLFKRYPDYRSLGSARLSDVETIIRSTGFYRNKSKNIIQLGRIITEKHQGILPDTREELVKLPGVGRKSANVILSLGFDKPAFAVDTHIMRVSQRLGYTEKRDPLKAEEALTSFIPEKQWKESHLILINHGRKICKAISPLCPDCPVRRYCPGAEKSG